MRNILLELGELIGLVSGIFQQVFEDFSGKW